MKQGELFATEPGAVGGVGGAGRLHRRLQIDLGLWVDPFTLAYISRAVARDEGDIEFIAADARSGRSAFHVMPSQALRGP